MKKLIVFFLLFASLCGRERIDLVSYTYYLLPIEQLAKYCPEILPIDSYPMKFERIREVYDVVPFYNGCVYAQNFTSDSDDLKKIIFFDYCEDPNVFRLPKSKMVLFKWEAIKIHPRFYEPYSVVYTCDDDLVDGKKFLKFYYPALLPMIDEIPSFQDRKFCTMVVSNWNRERIAMLDFFAKKPKGDFEFYGSVPDKFQGNEMYRGRIPGYYSGREKLSTLKNYRFCICFENTQTTKGYITEKIFCSFAAGCVPIYWGPKNIEKYIPKNCFINYRDFKTREELYQFMKAMTQETYERYIENIRMFIQSKEAQVFSPDYFDKTLYEATNR